MEEQRDGDGDAVMRGGKGEEEGVEEIQNEPLTKEIGDLRNVLRAKRDSQQQEEESKKDDDGDVEEGEIEEVEENNNNNNASNGSSGSKKSKWADDDDDEEEGDEAPSNKPKKNGMGSVIPPSSSSSATVDSNEPKKPTSSKWHNDDDEDEDEQMKDREKESKSLRSKWESSEHDDNEEAQRKSEKRRKRQTAEEIALEKVKRKREELQEASANSLPQSEQQQQPKSRPGSVASVSPSAGRLSPTAARAESNNNGGERGRVSPFVGDETVELMRCRNADEYEQLNRIAEGTYGVVFRAKEKKTGEIVALKKVKFPEYQEGFPVTALREITLMVSLRHPNVLGVREVVMTPKNQVFLVMEYLENDLKSVMDNMKNAFPTSQVKCLMKQLLDAINYLHKNWVVHRDLKTANILFGNGGVLKVCDYGMARMYCDPAKPMTSYVVTLHYRAPELLLLDKSELGRPSHYGAELDMWSVGCIMGELLLKETLFPGRSELDQINQVFRLLGTPNETTWPNWDKEYTVAKKTVFKNYPSQLRNRLPKMSAISKPTLSDAGMDLLVSLLAYDPKVRLAADKAIRHPWFNESPLGCHPSAMPTFPSQNEKGVRNKIKDSVERMEDEYRALLADDEARFNRAMAK